VHLKPLPCLMAAAILCGMAASAQAEAPLRVLLLSGQNNHDWQATTPLLEEMMAASGRFSVDLLDAPETMTNALLEPYDLIVSNWTDWPEVEDRAWGAEAEAAFLKFIRGGGGFALFHAASAAMQTWPEYQQIVARTWGLETTGHGRIHAFEVNLADEDHPILAGLQDFWISDELWHAAVQLEEPEEEQILGWAHASAERGGSGEDEPVLLTTRFGTGRCFYLILGHDVHSMRNPAWQTLMLRGAEWAATGEVSIPAATPWPTSRSAAEVYRADLEQTLEEVAAYVPGQPRDAMILASQFVYLASEDDALRARLLRAFRALAESDAAPTARAFACEQLGLLGGPGDAPLLTPLLAEPELEVAARTALLRIAGPENAMALEPGGQDNNE